MNKKTIIVSKLQRVGSNGSLKLNDSIWLSDVDYAQLTQQIGLTNEVNPMTFVGAKLSYTEVEVPKAGIEVMHPSIPNKKIVFKAHTSDVAIVRNIDFKVERLGIEDKEEVKLLNELSLMFGSSKPKASTKQRSAELEEITEEHKVPEVVNQTEPLDKPVIANSNAEQPAE